MVPMPTRILLIEDNPGDALLFEKALKEKEDPPYQLEKVERLSDGLDRLAKGGWDLILLDLFLPDSSGFATLRSVLQADPHTPVIILTGLNDRETAVKSLQEGAQDFLFKDSLNGEILNRSISYSIERYRLLRRVREEEERYFLAALGSHDGLWDWDLRSGRVYFSPRWKLMVGHSEEEIGEDANEWFDRVHPEDLDRVRRDLSDHLSGKTAHFSNEHRLRHKNGRYRWILSRGLAILDGRGQATRVAGSFTDITHHKNLEQQLALRAFYDPLTGLPNRPHFMESLKRAFQRQKRRSARLFALLFLDLDRLKAVNDGMGHQAGDLLLVEFARRLRSCVRPNDLVARIGGDEFTVILEDLQNHAEALEIAGRILRSLEAPFSLRNREASTSVSIGIAYSDCGREGPDGLIQAADAAMYQAKLSGKARYEVFKPDPSPPHGKENHAA